MGYGDEETRDSHERRRISLNHIIAPPPPPLPIIPQNPPGQGGVPSTAV